MQPPLLCHLFHDPTPPSDAYLLYGSPHVGRDEKSLHEGRSCQMLLSWLTFDIASAFLKRTCSEFSLSLSPPLSVRIRYGIQWEFKALLPPPPREVKKAGRERRERRKECCSAGFCIHPLRRGGRARDNLSFRPSEKREREREE